MSSGIKKFYLYLLAAVLLAGVYFVQESLNRDRDRLELTRVQPLENAPRFDGRECLVQGAG